MQVNSEAKVKTWHKLGYGVGAIAYATPYTIMAGSFLFFVTTILQVSPIIAGIIVAISVFWDAVTDPWIGAISDRANSKRFGRRHQFLLIGGIGTALGSICLWSISPDMALTMKVLMLLAAVLFAKTMNTLYGTPYFALSGSLSNDNNERTAIQGYRASFHLVGMLFAIVGTQILIFRPSEAFPRSQLDPANYPKVGVFIAVITIIFALVAYFATPKDHQVNPSTTRKSMWSLIRESLKNKSFRAIVLVIFLIEIVFQSIISLGTHVNTFTYHLNGPQMGILGLSLLGMSILSQPIWVFLCRRFELRNMLILGFIIGLAGFVGMPWAHVGFEIFPIDADSTLMTLAIFSGIAGIGNGAFMSIPFTMVAEAADVGELDTHERQEGLYFGMYTFAYKAGIAVSVLLAGVLLKVIGFDASLPAQTPSTSYHLAIAPTWFLIVIAPVIIWVLQSYTINHATHAKALTDLKAQRA